MIDLMQVFEKVVGGHAVLGHHAAQRRAVTAVEVLLLAEGVVGADVKKFGDKAANRRIDLLPQIEVMGIKGVVEIEHPGLDMRKAARFFFLLRWRRRRRGWR